MSQITLDDVAKAVGLSAAAVSMALNDRVGISKATRARVSRVAAEMGYQANAAAAVLGQRAKGRGTPKRLVVAKLSDLNSDPEPFRKMADGLGMDGLSFCLADFSSPEVASRILWSRGVNGILLDRSISEYWNTREWRSFQWARYSVVKEIQGFPELPCHVVRHGAFNYMARTLHEVVARGYRNIAYMGMKSVSAEDDDARMGALLNIKTNKLPEGVSLQWRQKEHSDSIHLSEADLEWIKSCNPDVIVLYHWMMVEALLTAGWHFPGPVGLAAVMGTKKRNPALPAITGCDVREGALTSSALLILRDMISRGERGFSEQILQHVIEPSWLEGETLPRVV